MDILHTSLTNIPSLFANVTAEVDTTKLDTVTHFTSMLFFRGISKGGSE